MKKNDSKSNHQLATPEKMEKIISFCKRRGFIFPAAEIYGGLGSSYTYGPYGVELKNNIKNLWWQKFVRSRDDVYGLDGPIILNPQLWAASGHLSGFNDALVDCKHCQKRFRADHLIFEATGEDLEGNLEAMNKVFAIGKIKCPVCGKSDWTGVRYLNMMFKTDMNGINEPVYLRPETAGAIFVEFNNILDVVHPKLPFGVAQIGKAFRNEIVTGNFIFRVRELEQMEIEYFINPTADWSKVFDYWLEQQKEFAQELGIKAVDLKTDEHRPEKLSFYSKKTVDLQYNFPFGWQELFGLAYRTDFDLKKHSENSNEKLEYFDTETNKRFTPHVIEPTFGLERSILAALLSAYTEEKVDGEDRLVMKFPKTIAPIKVAIFPLLKNKPELVTKAKAVYDDLKINYTCDFDDNGNIGKRYRRQDEIGTPYCVTIDFDSLTNNDVTIRDRDTMEQTRLPINELKKYLADNLK